MNNTYGAKLSKILLKNNIEIKLCYLQIGAIDVAILDKLCHSFIEHTFFRTHAISASIKATPSRSRLRFAPTYGRRLWGRSRFSDYCQTSWQTVAKIPPQSHL